MFCPNCGAEVRESDNFCFNCGRKLDFKKEKPDSKPKKEGKSKKSASKPRIKLECLIQGMDLKFKPNGSYRTYRIRKASLDDAIELIHKLPKKKDFPRKILVGLQRGEDLCPPTIILSNDDYSLNIFTTDGETIEFVTFSFRELAGYKFDVDNVTSSSVAVDRDEAERIVEDFYRKVSKVKGLRMGITPLEYSVLFAISRGVCNSKAISSITGVGIENVREAIRRLGEKGLIRLKKKGFLRKKMWYELTSDGERKLRNARKKVEKAVNEDSSMIDALAIPLFMMMVLDDATDIDADAVADVIGEPPDVAIVDGSADDWAYDDGGGWGDSGGDWGGDSGDGGDWGGDDGGADGAW